MSVINSRWVGTDDDRWSGVRREAKWFPNVIQKNLLYKCVDSTSSETTSVYLEYHKGTGKVFRINNDGKTYERELIIKLKTPNWTRVYIISADKKGEDYTSIDHPVTVSDLILIKEQGQWKLEDNIEITIEDNHI